jgi:hypothetical protein
MVWVLALSAAPALGTPPSLLVGGRSLLAARLRGG